MSDKIEPPREVWVMSSKTGADFVSTHRQDAMDRASDWAADFPENGPYRVCRYVAEPFADDNERIAELEREVKHWKANHDNQVERARILMERTDLPIERVEAYKNWKELEREVEQLGCGACVVKGGLAADEGGVVYCKLERELTEQARLNGMGSEREAALMAKVERLERDLETERTRLAACGVIALADTPDSAAAARAMRDEYRSASCDDVARRVDECMRLREELAAAQATIQQMREAIEGHCEFHEIETVAFDRALALPADRTALDAMLAEARKEGLLEAAKDIALNWLPNLRRREPESSQAKAEHNFIIDRCVKHVLCYVPLDQEDSQAAERSE